MKIELSLYSVISKLNKRAAQVRFEITSMISDQNCTTPSSITTLIHQFYLPFDFFIQTRFEIGLVVLFPCAFFIGWEQGMRFRAKNGAIWE